MIRTQYRKGKWLNSNSDEIVLIPRQNMKQTLKDLNELKIMHPNSEHNKKLLRENNYQHGKHISETASSLREMREKMIDAGYNIP